MMENLLESHPQRILADYYDRRPFSPLCRDVFPFSSKVQSLSSLILTESPASLQHEMLLIEETSDDPVYKMERNLWKNCEHLEEILCLLQNSRWSTMLRQPSTMPGDIEFARILPKIADMLQNSLDQLVAFQDRIDERVLSSVNLFIDCFICFNFVGGSSLISMYDPTVENCSSSENCFVIVEHL